MSHGRRGAEKSGGCLAAVTGEAFVAAQLRILRFARSFDNAPRPTA